MTDATIALSELVEKEVDADSIRQTLQHALQRLMEMDAESLCRAAYGERSDERINSRNGYQHRSIFDQPQQTGVSLILRLHHCVTRFM